MDFSISNKIGGEESEFFFLVSNLNFEVYTEIYCYI